MAAKSESYSRDPVQLAYQILHQFFLLQGFYKSLSELKNRYVIVQLESKYDGDDQWLIDLTLIDSESKAKFQIINFAV